jgi:hypothetical protein
MLLPQSLSKSEELRLKALVGNTQPWASSVSSSVILQGSAMVFAISRLWCCDVAMEEDLKSFKLVRHSWVQKMSRPKLCGEFFLVQKG